MNVEEPPDVLEKFWTYLVFWVVAKAAFLLVSDE
jgi:hypothetical protein